MKTLFVRFAKDESGVTAIEYGLIAALIGVAIIAGARLLGTELNELFGDIAGTMEDVTPVGGGGGTDGGTDGTDGGTDGTDGG